MEKYIIISIIPIIVYEEPNENSEKLLLYYNNNIIDVLEITENEWAKTNDGWIYTKNKARAPIIEKVESIISESKDVGIGDIVSILDNDTYFTNTRYPERVTLNNLSKKYIVLNVISNNSLIESSDNLVKRWIENVNLKIEKKGLKRNPVKQVLKFADPVTPPVTDRPLTEEEKAEPERVKTKDETFANSLQDFFTGFGVGVKENYQSALDGLRIKTLRGIHGMPYQYMAHADRRIDDYPGSFGRKYAEKIVSKIPLLLMTPGAPEFMSKSTADDKRNLLSTSYFGNDSDLDKLLSKEGQYYSFKFDYVEYFDYVSPMCRAAAQFLNIGDVLLDKTALKNYQWADMNNGEIHKYLNYKGAVAFYIHSDTQIGDSFSNSTTESMLAGKINGLSDLAKELNFVMGGASTAMGIKYDMFNAENLNNDMNSTNKMIDSIMDHNDILKGINAGVKTIMAGGKLRFPEIWSDSSFSRSYDVTIKLTTPDLDKFSWYMNIAVPIFHLMGFSLPRQVGPNGFVSPFLVRAFYKGLFNCDMGIITSFSVSKGQEGSWTKEGLPTVVDVNFTIKDLYNVMAMSRGRKSTPLGREDHSINLLSNIALMDYIANLCGININEPDIIRMVDMYYTHNYRNRISDFVQLDIPHGLEQWWTNKVNNIFRF